MRKIIKFVVVYWCDYSNHFKSIVDFDTYDEAETYALHSDNPKPLMVQKRFITK